MKRSLFATVAVAALLAGGDRAGVDAQGPGGAAPRMPVFDVDPTFPKLPNNWVMGHVPGIAVDARDHVFILQRPRTVPEDKRHLAAPPVLEFDADGRFVNAWGGPGQGYDWPDSEHGIAVDYKGNVWIGGSSPTSQSLTRRSDDMLLKFTREGSFLLQIGGRDSSGGNKDRKSVKKSADVYVYPKSNEAFVADGYGNRRVVVYDADTGAFKRMWGAFGNVPEDAPEPATGGNRGAAAAGGRAGAAPPRPLDTEGDGAQQFGSPVHGIKVSNDGLVYVADRPNRRVQVFTPDGKYVTQVFINRSGPSANSAAGVAFSPDQQFLYIADYGNSRIVVLDRKALKVLYQFGNRSPKPGDFQGPHHLAVDSKGNLYTAEVSPGNRAQRFVFKGLTSTIPGNALTQAQPGAGR